MIEKYYFCDNLGRVYSEKLGWNTETCTLYYEGEMSIDDLPTLPDQTDIWRRIWFGEEIEEVE